MKKGILCTVARAGYPEPNGEYDPEAKALAVKIAKALGEKGVTDDVPDQFYSETTALILASMHGYVEMVECLIKIGGDLNAQIKIDGDFNKYFNSKGERSAPQFTYGTALDIASWCGHDEVVKLLRSAGAICTTLNGERETSLNDSGLENRTDTGNIPRLQGNPYDNKTGLANIIKNIRTSIQTPFIAFIQQIRAILTTLLNWLSALFSASAQNTAR